MTVEPQMRQEDWQVRLPDFEGPFDLLLHLVRRGELDVSTMPLHEVADEYLEILARISRYSSATSCRGMVETSSSPRRTRCNNRSKGPSKSGKRTCQSS